MILLLLLVAVSMTCEGGSLFLFPRSFWLFFLSHLAAASIFSFSVSTLLSKKLSQRGILICSLLLSLLLPGYGMAGMVILTLLLLFRPLPKGDLLEEFKEHTVLPIVEPEAPTRAKGGVEAPAEGGAAASQDLLSLHLQVEPLVDMLKTPDPQMKRAVIEEMAKKRDPKLIPHILSCLKDPHPEVYQYAMAKILKLQGEFAQQIAEAQQKVKESPDSAEAHQSLAEVYEGYLTSGLVDPALISYYTSLLIDEYETLLTVRPDDHSLRIHLGRLYRKGGDAEKASKEFETVLSSSPHLHGLNARMELVETYYTQRKYPQMFDQIRKIAQDHLHEETRDPHLVELAQWWLNVSIQPPEGKPDG